MTTIVNRLSLIQIVRENPDDFFLSNAKEDPIVFLLGNEEEQWTSAALTLLNKHKVPVTLLPWEHILEVRSLLELVRYPVIQFWVNGSLKKCVVGFHAGEIKNLVDIYFKAVL